MPPTLSPLPPPTPPFLFSYSFPFSFFFFRTLVKFFFLSLSLSLLEGPLYTVLSLDHRRPPTRLDHHISEFCLGLLVTLLGSNALVAVRTCRRPLASLSLSVFVIVNDGLCRCMSLSALITVDVCLCRCLSLSMYVILSSAHRSRCLCLGLSVFVNIRLCHQKCLSW